MSTATVSNGIQRRERKGIGESTQGESAAPSAPEQTTTNTAPENPSPVGPQGIDRAALLAAYEQSFDRSVKSVGAILDNTALSVYCQVGADCYDTIYLAKALFDAEVQERLGKDAKSQWSTTDYDDQCSRLSMRCRVLFPHLFRPSKEESDKADAEKKKRDPVRISDYVLAFLAVGVIRPIVGDAIDNVSFFLVINYIARKCVSFSRTDLNAEIRSEWSEFIRVNVPSVASGRILVRDFLSLMDTHESRLSEAKTAEKYAGKTPEQIAQAEKEAELKKAAREKSARENKVRTALSTSLADAFAGVLEPEQVSAIIVKSASDAHINLPGAINPETVQASELLDILKSMFMLKRFAEVRAICDACADMATMLDKFDTRPTAMKNAG